MSGPNARSADKAQEAFDDALPDNADHTDVMTVIPKTSAKDLHERHIREALQPNARHGRLATPRSHDRLLRSPSPSNLSILSNEELDELNSSPRSQSYGNESKVSSQAEKSGRFQRFWANNKGVVWALFAQLFGTMMNIGAQELETRGNKGNGFDAFEILFVRMGITVFFSCLYMWQRATPDFPFGPKGVRLLLCGRALGGFVGVWSMYFSLRYLPVQLAVVITFLAPFLTNYACSKIYGEPFTRTDVITGIISLAGVVLLAHPESLIASLMGNGSEDENVPPASGSGDVAPGEGGAEGHLNATAAEQAMAVGVSLLGVLGSAVAYTTIRVIGKRAHPLISVNYFGTFCFLISSIILAIKRHVTLPSDPRDWGLLIFLGVCGFTMQFLLAKGLAHEKSAKATNMQFSQMFFAMLGDKILFGYTPDVKALLGSGLIITGVIAMVMQKAPAAKQDPEHAGLPDDEESRTGLLSDSNDRETGEDHDRIST